MADTKVTISLRKRLIRLHKKRRMLKAPDYLRERVAKLANVDVQTVRIHQGINHILMSKVSKNMQDFEAEIRREATYVEVRPITAPVQQQSANAKDGAAKKTDSKEAKAASAPKQGKKEEKPKEQKPKKEDKEKAAQLEKKQ